MLANGSPGRQNRGLIKIPIRKSLSGVGMRTAFGPMTLCLLLLAATIGCSPGELSPEELEKAAVGTWKDQKGFPIELRADKTLTTPIVSSTEGRQERSG